MNVRAALAVFLSALMVWFPAFSVSAAPAALGKVVPIGPADLNGTRLALETTIYPGDTIATAADGLSTILLPQGARLHLGPSTKVQVSQSKGMVVASLEQGAALARSENSQNVAIGVRGLLVTPRAAARYEVALAENAVVVAATDGMIDVRGGSEFYTVPTGQAMRFELAPGPQGPGGGKKALVLATLVVGIGLGVLAGWIIATERAEDRCLERLAVSPSAPTSICQF